MTLFDPDKESPYKNVDTLFTAIEFDSELHQMVCPHNQWDYRGTPWFIVMFGETKTFCREMVCVDCKAMSLLGPLVAVDEEDKS